MALLGLVTVTQKWDEGSFKKRHNKSRKTGVSEEMVARMEEKREMVGDDKKVIETKERQSRREWKKSRVGRSLRY